MQSPCSVHKYIIINLLNSFIIIVLVQMFYLVSPEAEIILVIYLCIISRDTVG